MAHQGTSDNPLESLPTRLLHQVLGNVTGLTDKHQLLSVSRTVSKISSKKSQSNEDFIVNFLQKKRVSTQSERL